MCRLLNYYNAGPVSFYYVTLILGADGNRFTFICIEYISPKDDKNFPLNTSDSYANIILKTYNTLTPRWLVICSHSSCQKNVQLILVNNQHEAQFFQYAYFSADDRLVCRSICSFIPDGHLHRV